MTLRHKHGHSGMLSHSLTYSKPLTFAEMIPDLDGMVGEVRRAGEMRLHFLARCLSITTSPALHSWVIHSIMYTQACRDSCTMQLSLQVWLSHKLILVIHQHIAVDFIWYFSNSQVHTHTFTNLISQSIFKNDLTSWESCLRFHTEQTDRTVQHTHIPRHWVFVSFISHIYCALK